MDRKATLLAHISKEAQGVEIGPYFSPLAPKREGYNCLSLDVFDTDTVRARAAADKTLAPEASSLIEPVDLVGGAVEIDRLCRARGVEALDYVVSSHNFEHLPDPIGFLQACGRVLKSGGLLVMALPDKRACFDFYRPRTRLAEWIEAFDEGRRRPSLAQIFDQDSSYADYIRDNAALCCFPIDERLDRIAPRDNLHVAFAAWRSRRAQGNDAYIDAHCWTFTPGSFRLLLTDAFFLGLSPFALEEVTDTAQTEFFVRLRHVGYRTFTEEETAAHYARRRDLLRAAVEEDASAVAAARVCAVFDHMRERRASGPSLLARARALALLLRSRNFLLYRQYLAVAGSLFFDARDYARREGVRGDAALHYLMEGGRAGRDPGSFFSSGAYLDKYPDVAESGMKPLAHFELFGRAEGRMPTLR